LNVGEACPARRPWPRGLVQQLPAEVQRAFRRQILVVRHRCDSPFDVAVLDGFRQLLERRQAHAGDELAGNDCRARHEFLVTHLVGAEDRGQTTIGFDEVGSRFLGRGDMAGRNLGRDHSLGIALGAHDDQRALVVLGTTAPHFGVGPMPFGASAVRETLHPDHHGCIRWKRLPIVDLVHRPAADGAGRDQQPCSQAIPTRLRAADHDQASWATVAARQTDPQPVAGR
jgi:hypothetical protein